MLHVINRYLVCAYSACHRSALFDQQQWQRGMGRWLGVALVTLGLITGWQSAQAADTAQEVRDFMSHYLEKFDNGYRSEIVAHYDVPLMMLAPNGDLRTYETAKDIRLTMKKWKMHMIRAGIARTEFVQLNVKTLSDNTAMASTVFNRYSNSNEVFQHGGATYSLRKADGKWKIFLIHIHDPAMVLAFR